MIENCISQLVGSQITISNRARLQRAFALEIDPPVVRITSVDNLMRALYNLQVSTSCDIRSEEIIDLAKAMKEYHNDLRARFPQLAKLAAIVTSSWCPMSSVKSMDDFCRSKERVAMLLEQVERDLTMTMTEKEK